MKTNHIDILVYSQDGTIAYDREFDTIKEAKQWVKGGALTAEFWERMMESETPGWAKRNIDAIQVVRNSEVVADYFPKF